ncbi:MAG: hypothetical protein H7222_16695 [Methylotenera sp.]|nr:hypothetical protein [Oligoflexia bacterium]
MLNKQMSHLRFFLAGMVSSITVGILALVIFSGCDRAPSTGGDPQKRLTEYISTSFSIKEYKDKEQLLQFLSGDAKTRLTAWSEEQFRQAFLDSKRKFIKLVIRETKRPSATETNITYELVYTDESKGSNAKVTNKKMSQFVLENGKWYIKEVSNIKELVEYQNEMSLP